MLRRRLAMLCGLCQLLVSLTTVRRGEVWPNVDPGWNTPYAGTPRHFDGANYLLADGHVKWYKPDAVSAGAAALGETNYHAQGGGYAAGRLALGRAAERSIRR